MDLRDEIEAPEEELGIGGAPLSGVRGGEVDLVEPEEPFVSVEEYIPGGRPFGPLLVGRVPALPPAIASG